MKLRNAYYLEFTINRDNKEVSKGSMVTFNTSLNAAKQDIKLGYHRSKGTRFKFTKVECFGENISVDEYVMLLKEKKFEIYRR